MTLLRPNAFNPWRDFDRIFAALDQGGGWVPSFDSKVTDAAYVLTGDLPGMEQKELEVRVEDGVLTVRGERKAPEAGDAVRWHRRERPRGKFARAFRLPEDVNEAEVKATYENGVLELTLPRQEPVDTSRLIPVS